MADTTMVTDDILILKLIRSKNEQAFKYLFNTYFVPLCRYANLFLNDTENSEDIVMDIMVYIWEHADKIDLVISLKAYLFQTAHNRCLNYLRDKKETLSLDSANHLTTDDYVLPLIETQELHLLIQEAICSLPDKCKQVFLLSRNEKCTNQQIADKMNISIKTVEAQITKALKRIKQHLGEHYYFLF